MELSDSGGTIDDVTYDSTTWVTTVDGYAYELISKSFDNDAGANWAQSCSVLGTPGSDPSETCNAECIVDGCGDGGTCDTETTMCTCDSGYYPQCTSPTSCTSCLEVPDVSECTVEWFKNSTTTERWAWYSWSDIDRDGDTQFELNYFANSKSGGPIDVDGIYGTAFYVFDDYYAGNTSYGGYVRTALEVCTESNTTSQLCLTYYGAKTLCTVTTQAPSSAPTTDPTTYPSMDPTMEPTMAPTWECPTVWWTNDELNCIYFIYYYILRDFIIPQKFISIFISILLQCVLNG